MLVQKEGTTSESQSTGPSSSTLTAQLALIRNTIDHLYSIFNKAKQDSDFAMERNFLVNTLLAHKKLFFYVYAYLLHLKDWSFVQHTLEILKEHDYNKEANVLTLTLDQASHLNLERLAHYQIRLVAIPVESMISFPDPDFIAGKAPVDKSESKHYLDEDEEGTEEDDFDEDEEEITSLSIPRSALFTSTNREDSSTSLKVSLNLLLDDFHQTDLLKSRLFSFAQLNAFSVFQTQLNYWTIAVANAGGLDLQHNPSHPSSGSAHTYFEIVKKAQLEYAKLCDEHASVLRRVSLGKKWSRLYTQLKHQQRKRRQLKPQPEKTISHATTVRPPSPYEISMLIDDMPAIHQETDNEESYEDQHQGDIENESIMSVDFE